MSSTMLLMKVTCLTILLCIILGQPQSLASALTCGQIEAKLAPCIPYVTGIVGAVPQPCCDGVRAINKQAAAKDRQAACRCIKKAANAVPGLNVIALAGVPGKCGVNLPYNLGPSTDCNKIE
ncbi:unnamed protein product [Lathyrus sativus]|nr:unnamed protein product [Lathyrus sativus]